MNMGLLKGDNGSYSIGHIKNLGLSKRHTRGVTSMAEEVSNSINAETFQEQVDALSSLVGQSVYLSSVKNIIVEKDLKVHHSNFDNFRLWLANTSNEWTPEQRYVLRTSPLQLNEKNDFAVDAFQVFSVYMAMFAKQDSYVVKKETEKIMKITQFFIRQQALSKILDLA